MANERKSQGKAPRAAKNAAKTAGRYDRSGRPNPNGPYGLVGGRIMYLDPKTQRWEAADNRTPSAVVAALTGSRPSSIGIDAASASALGYVPRPERASASRLTVKDHRLEEYKRASESGKLPPASPFEEVTSLDRELSMLSVTSTQSKGVVLVPFHPLRPVIGFLHDGTSYKVMSINEPKRDLAAVANSMTPLAMSISLGSSGSANVNARSGIAEAYYIAQPLYYNNLDDTMEQIEFLKASFNRRSMLNYEKLEDSFPIAALTRMRNPIELSSTSALTSSGAVYEATANIAFGQVATGNVMTSISIPPYYNGKISVSVNAFWTSAGADVPMTGVNIRVNSVSSNGTPYQVVDDIYTTSTTTVDVYACVGTLTFDVNDYLAADAALTSIGFNAGSGGKLWDAKFEVVLHDFNELDNHLAVVQLRDFSAVAGDSSWHAVIESHVSYPRTKGSEFAQAHVNKHWLSIEDHVEAQNLLLAAGPSEFASASFLSVVKKISRAAVPAMKIASAVVPSAPARAILDAGARALE